MILRCDDDCGCDLLMVLFVRASVGGLVLEALDLLEDAEKASAAGIRADKQQIYATRTKSRRIVMVVLMVDWTWVGGCMEMDGYGWFMY